MRVLITGGAGFIGSHVAEELLSAGHNVLVIDNFSTGRRDTLRPNTKGLSIMEDTIADREAVDRAFKASPPEMVIHCAASYKDPENWAEDSRTNVLGTANVVQASAKAKVRRFIYFQTSLCYGNHPHEQPVTLDHPVNPQSSYAISKTAAEQYIALSGLNFVSFRLANMYGPRNLSGPVPTFYKRLSEGKKCFAMKTRRDFIFIQDLVQVVLMAVGGKGKGYYHVATGSDYTIKELYDAVASALDVHDPVEERERTADDAPTILLDPARTAKDFGWKATTPLREGIRKAVEWYKTHGVDQTFTHLRLED